MSKKQRPSNRRGKPTKRPSKKQQIKNPVLSRRPPRQPGR